MCEQHEEKHKNVTKKKKEKGNKYISPTEAKIRALQAYDDQKMRKLSELTGIIALHPKNNIQTMELYQRTTK